MAPKRLLADAPPAPLLDRHAERAARAVAHRIPALDRVFAADPAQFFGKDRAVFDPVPVGVDDRMVESRLDLRCREMSAQRGLLGGSCDEATLPPLPPGCNREPSRAYKRSQLTCSRPGLPRPANPRLYPPRQ